MNDSEQPFEEVLEFLSDEDRQRRMEDSEIHHYRAPLAGVVRELESLPAIDKYFAGVHSSNSKRLRQAIGVTVRMIMECRGWKKTGKKGSLGIRTAAPPGTIVCNSGGLALWFLRAERYELAVGMPFRLVAERSQELQAVQPGKSAKGHQ